MEVPNKMDVPIIQMDHDAVLKKYEVYRASVRQQHNAVDAALEKGYKALSQGKQLIDLHAALASAGLNEKGLPNLAITRAHAPICFWSSNGKGGGAFTMDRWPRSNATRRIIHIPDGIFPRGQWGSGKAIVPYIPLEYRPHRGLHNYHILWEAEWESIPIDPFLLRHCAGSLYIVLAQWDLTPLEQAVLKGMQS